MVKRLCAALFALLLCLPAFAFAQEASRQVEDGANALSAEQVLAITEVIDDIEKKYQVDIVVLITNDTPTLSPYEDNTRVEDYAHDFYDYNGYGMGEDFSGMLYMIDVKNGIQCISGSGMMMTYINDSREEAIFNVAQRYLRENDWGGASLAAVRKIRAFMAAGVEEGTFLYDEATGRRLSGVINRLTVSEIALSLLAGGAVAVVICLIVSSSYGLKGSTYSYDLASGASCSITEADEQFLRESVSRVARSSGSSGGGGSSHGGRSGGSGVRRSSSGRMHSGGSRRF